MNDLQFADTIGCIYAPRNGCRTVVRLRLSLF
uniref:Uncharacterized protein n=1 Tax=Anguilla anguilla TaxID=7936 RepID=A0A0E9UBF8_ANGAN